MRLRRRRAGWPAVIAAPAVFFATSSTAFLLRSGRALTGSAAAQCSFIDGSARRMLEEPQLHLEWRGAVWRRLCRWDVKLKAAHVVDPAVSRKVHLSTAPLPIPGAPPAERLTDEEEVNVVLTHAVCDFDSLASAVGLAKLWSHKEKDRPCVVVMPQGAHPSVENFLALHSVLFPIRPLALVDPAKVSKLGIVDASTKDRLGPGRQLLETAQEVFVFDHHAMKTPDIEATQLILDDVGSVSTMVTEMLRDADVPLTDAEATLLAIGIHADTGSMTFDSCTPRDVEALAWVMRQGAKQSVIAEYCHQRLTSEQQMFLSESFQRLNMTVCAGVKIGTVIVNCRDFVGGLARVAQHVLELSSCDVVVWGGLYTQGSGRKQSKRMVLIGRARSGLDFINFNEIWSQLGGGGHQKAAAANIKFDDPERWRGEEHVISFVVDGLKRQISTRTTFKDARDVMSYPVLTCTKDLTMLQVAQLLRRHKIHGMPVVGKEGGEADLVLGLVTHMEVLKAMKAEKLDSPVSGWYLKKFQCVKANTPLEEIKEVMMEHDGRDVLVLDTNGRLVGIVSKSDILKSYEFYDSDSYSNQLAFCNDEWSSPAEARHASPST